MDWARVAADIDPVFDATGSQSHPALELAADQEPPDPKPRVQPGAARVFVVEVELGLLKADPGAPPLMLPGGERDGVPVPNSRAPVFELDPQVCDLPTVPRNGEADAVALIRRA